MINFKPKLNYEQLENQLFQKDAGFLSCVKIESDELFDLANQLSQKAEPNLVPDPKMDRRWLYFYLPIEYEKKLALLPIFLAAIKECYCLRPKSFTGISITEGSEKVSEIYKDILTETIRFIPLIKTDPKFPEKLVPYQFRTGRIKGKYMMEELLPKEEAERILKNYKKYLKKNLAMEEISLNDYLKVASFCYNAVFPDERASELELYERYADFRHGGMLELKDWNSKSEFTRWYESDKWSGSHPFEIIYSSINHGILLYPPSKESPRYKLSVGNEWHYRDFLKIAEKLIEKEVPFGASGLNDALKYLEGESYFEVNDVGISSVECASESDPIFKYVKWNPLPVPKWKS